MRSRPLASGRSWSRPGPVFFHHSRRTGRRRRARERAGATGSMHRERRAGWRQERAFGHAIARGYDRTMTLASWRRSTAFAAFALLALIAELVGRSATLRLDRALSVVTPLATPTTRYYPFLLAGVKVLGSLTVAALAWRIIRAHAMARAAERLLGTIGHRRLGDLPRPRVRLSARLWLASFAATSLWYLVQNDYERDSQGRWPLLAPWLHTY